jgi:hypothetical protein
MNWKVIVEAQKMNEAVTNAVIVGMVEEVIETYGLGDLLLETDISKIDMARLARSIGVGVSGSLNTIGNRINSQRIITLDPTNKATKHGSKTIHHTATKNGPRGNLSLSRWVREPGYMAEGTRYDQMNTLRGVDSGLHLEDRDVCPRCDPVTIPLNTSICRECGLDTFGMQVRTVRRPTTHNHTETGNFVILCKNRGSQSSQRRNPTICTVASVNFQKLAQNRVKTGGAKNYFHLTPMLAWVTCQNMEYDPIFGDNYEALMWVYVDNEILRDGGFQ